MLQEDVIPEGVVDEYVCPLFDKNLEDIEPEEQQRIQAFLTAPGFAGGKGLELLLGKNRFSSEAITDKIIAWVDMAVDLHSLYVDFSFNKVNTEDLIRLLDKVTSGSFSGNTFALHTPNCDTNLLDASRLITVISQKLAANLFPDNISFCFRESNITSENIRPLVIALGVVSLPAEVNFSFSNTNLDNDVLGLVLDEIVSNPSIRKLSLEFDYCGFDDVDVEKVLAVARFAMAEQGRKIELNLSGNTLNSPPQVARVHEIQVALRDLGVSLDQFSVHLMDNNPDPENNDDLGDDRPNDDPPDDDAPDDGGDNNDQHKRRRISPDVFSRSPSPNPPAGGPPPRPMLGGG